MTYHHSVTPTQLYHNVLLVAWIRYGDGIFRYGDGAGNTVDKNSSIFSLIRMRSDWTLLVGRQEGHPACKKWGDGGGGHWLVRMEWCPADGLHLPLLIFPCVSE